MRRLLRLIGLKRSRRIIVKMLETHKVIYADFQSRVEQMGGQHSPYYSKAKRDCENIDNAIRLIKKEHMNE